MTADRYEGRVVDIAGILAKPPQPTPWRVHDLVADGTLTILSGESGAGKSWLAQALCVGVARGQEIAGLPCEPGTALYVDAEMGAEMFVNARLRPSGIGAEFVLVDAMGLDVSKAEDLDWLRRLIEHYGVNLVVLDSLRRLAPSKAENDSDAMAPVVAAVAKLARDCGVAIIVIHHKGDGEKFFRGSSSIKDQADALFGLLVDEEGDGPLRLTCRPPKGKPPRYAPAPADLYLAISPEDGGVTAADGPVSFGRKLSATASVMAAIEAALPAKTKAEVAKRVGRPPDDTSFRRAWKALEDGERISKEGSAGWRVVIPDPRDPENNPNLEQATILQFPGGDEGAS